MLSAGFASFIFKSVSCYINLGLNWQMTVFMAVTNGASANKCHLCFVVLSFSLQLIVSNYHGRQSTA